MRGDSRRPRRLPPRQDATSAPVGRSRRLGIVVGLVPVVLSMALSAPSSADIGSDQARIQQLQQQIAAQGARVQQLVESYDAAQARVAAIEAQVQSLQAQLATDRRTEDADRSSLRQAALQFYMNGSAGDSLAALFSSGSSDALAARQEYSHLASSTIDGAIDAVRSDEQRTKAVGAALQAEEDQARTTLAQLDQARQAAQAALAQDDALLARTQGDLQNLLAAAAAQQAAAERAKEQALAQQAAEAQAAQVAATMAPVTITATPGTYVNPLRAIRALSPERIDQGVDYRGYGPIYAVGDGTVLSTVNSGWPGGTFISYRLTDGKAAGLVVYAAEDIDPLVTVGQQVTATTVLGTMYEGPDGIETGWADRSGDGTTMAHDAGQFSGSNSTAFGANFSQLLASLGAPPGILQNDPPTGTLPPGWPTW